MKYAIILFLVVSTYLLSAQEIVHTIETNPSQKQKIVNKYSCFFRTMEDQDRLLKVGLNNFSTTPFPIFNFYRIW